MIETFEKGRLLKSVTTFGIGGPADYFIEVKTITEMQEVLAFCYRLELPYFILGKGSNVLFHDQGFHGLVIQNRIDFSDCKDEIWHIGAGYSFSLLGTQTARKGFSGLEFASGIPGSVGGAVFMNAGANGVETNEALLSVDFVNEKGELIVFSKDELEFSYRFSSFHNMKGSIVGATFHLEKNSIAREKQLKIIHYRKRTQPYNEKSAGCVFRNPLNGHAGALIEQCGLKGKSHGTAQISDLHANFIINKGSAQSEDILKLIHDIIYEVKEKTGIELESEIRCIPYDPKKV